MVLIDNELNHILLKLEELNQHKTVKLFHKIKDHENIKKANFIKELQTIPLDFLEELQNEENNVPKYNNDNSFTNPERFLFH